MKQVDFDSCVQIIVKKTITFATENIRGRFKPNTFIAVYCILMSAILLYLFGPYIRSTYVEAYFSIG